MLATACNKKLALSVSQYLGIFDEVIASDDKRNLRGSAKAKALINRFGVRGFSYLGNDRTDLEVWKDAYSGVLVNTKKSVNTQAKRIVEIEAEIAQSQNKLKTILLALRPHHWIKNMLVFVPIILSKKSELSVIFTPPFDSGLIVTQNAKAERPKRYRGI